MTSNNPCLRVLSQTLLFWTVLGNPIWCAEDQTPAGNSELSSRPAKSQERAGPRQDNSLSVLGEEAPKLLRDYLLRRIHAQYDARRVAVKQALQSSEALLRRQQRLRASLKTIVGQLPTQSPLLAEVTGVIQEVDYRIEKVVYQSRPHHYVTANLYLPTTGQPPYPGVLVACGHSGQGKAYELYQRVAILLAKNGFVALVYDPIGQGERIQFVETSHNPGLQHKLANVNSILVGRTAVGYEAWDGVRSVDYLLARPEVDGEKPIGMTGNSGGGAQTMYLMALDDRIGPAAPSCHITTLERNFELGGAGDGCQSAPLTGAEGIDHPDFFVMRAPKPSIILSAEQDYKDIRFTRITFQETKAVYRLLRATERMQMFAYDDKHAFSQPRREMAVSWMRRWLLNDPSPVTEPDLRIQTVSALRVTTSGSVMREYKDALSVANLNLLRAKQLADSRKKTSGSKTKREWLAKIRQLVGVGVELPQAQAESRGVVEREKYRIERFVFKRHREPPVPALLFLPNSLRQRNPATLIVDGRGKQAGLQAGGIMQERLAQGHVVLSIDARGFGETSDVPSDVVYAKGDHRVAMWSLHVGQTLLGQRIEDVLASADFLSKHERVDADAVHLVGTENGGPVALHAAALDGRFASIVLRNSIHSWVEDVVAKPLDVNSISHVVPSALLHYDLPDLAAVLGDKLTIRD